MDFGPAPGRVLIFKGPDCPEWWHPGGSWEGGVSGKSAALAARWPRAGRFRGPPEAASR